MLQRFFRHFIASYWQAQRQFPASVRAAITRAIARSEMQHAAELRFVVEAALSPTQLLQRMTARERALEVFSALRVWDTEHNSGVLIYVLLGDHAVEIVADRGIARRLREQDLWPPVMARLQQAFAAGQVEAGAVAAVEMVGEHLIRHFPVNGPNPDELPDDVSLI